MTIRETRKTNGWLSILGSDLLGIWERLCGYRLYTSTPAQKLMSKEELVKRTGFGRNPCARQTQGKTIHCPWPDNPVQRREDCGDEGFSPSAEWQRKRRGMATDLWCMKCSKRGIKPEQSEMKAWKVSAVYFPVLFFWSPIPLYMEPQPQRHPYPSVRLMLVKDACSQPKCEMA